MLWLVLYFWRWRDFIQCGQDRTCSVQLYIIVCRNFGMVLNCSDQGRTQDLSEGGTRFFGTKKSWFRIKKTCCRRDFFSDRYFSCFALGFLFLKCYWGAILKSQEGLSPPPESQGGMLRYCRPPPCIRPCSRWLDRTLCGEDNTVHQCILNNYIIVYRERVKNAWMVMNSWRWLDSLWCVVDRTVHQCTTIYYCV